MKSRSDLPPGLNFVEDEKPKDSAGLSKSAKKNLKRKEKKKQATAEGGPSVQNVTDSMAATSISGNPKDMNASNLQNADNSNHGATSQPQSEEADLAKRLKNLKKKLRQIEGLEAKIQSGELPNPEKEQLDKVARKSEIISEIEDLELELADV